MTMFPYSYDAAQTRTKIGVVDVSDLSKNSIVATNIRFPILIVVLCRSLAIIFCSSRELFREKLISMISTFPNTILVIHWESMVINFTDGYQCCSEMPLNLLTK